MAKKILIVENDAAYLEELSGLLRDFGDTEIYTETLYNTAIEKLKDRVFLDELDFVLVDLELGGARGPTPGDYFGRDKILRTVRDEAPWIPVVLISVYVRNDINILAKLTPFGFDAILPKGFFSNTTIYRDDWTQLREAAAASRVASLTGKGVQDILDRKARPLNLSFGHGIEAELAKYDRDHVETCLKLSGISEERIVLDEVVQGFSGLSVFKASVDLGGTACRWLVKLGDGIEKLDREAKAHRRAFTDGLTRKFSVPLLWWSPVTWRSVGMIAYEYAEDATTLLDAARCGGVEDALVRLGSALRQLYSGSIEHTVVPREALSRLVRKGGDHEVSSAIVRALLDGTGDARLDSSIRLMMGVRRAKGGDSQWVRIPPGSWSLQPVAIGAAVEVTKPSEPSMERVA